MKINKVNEKITRKEFEDKCEHLFRKIKILLKDVLKKAKLKKNDIHEVILVGGSIKIPKVREIIKNYFKKSKINDIISPDEAVAFGATLLAESILHRRNEIISNLNLIDSIPFSLGTNIENCSKDKNIQNEGDIMDVIIKRGTYIPCHQTLIYYYTDYGISPSFNIYEGEKKYVKYNYLIKKTTILGFTRRKIDEILIFISFVIDPNGILSVRAEERSHNNEDQKIILKIINDDMTFTEYELDKLKKKNREMFDKISDNFSLKMDYTNLKETLKLFQDAYNEFDKKPNNEDYDDDEPIYIKICFNNTLEEFIDKLDKKFDNETVLEKFYLYV